MTPKREAGFYIGGLLGAGLTTAIEWAWQGNWVVGLYAIALMLLMAIGFAAIGRYIAGFLEDSKAPDAEPLSKNFPETGDQGDA